MSRVLTIGVIALAMATAGWGTTLCTTGTLASYVALGSTGCQIDDKVFSNFTASLTKSTGVTITVTPDSTPGDPGLDFQLSGFTATGGASNDLVLGFTVNDLSGPNIEDASLGIAGVTSTGGSEVTIGESLCVGGTFSGATCSTGGTPPHELSLTVTDPPPSFSDGTPLGPTATVGVLKDVSITSGVDGVAALSFFSQNFSEVVPEPASIVLLGSALLGLGLLRRRLS